MKILLATLFAASLLLGPAGARAQDELSCEDYRCVFQERLLAECNCETAANHGRYVSCAAHIIKDLVRNEGLPRKCKGKLQRCAARSVCGKQDRGFVTCTTFQYGTCVDSLCDTDGTTACTGNTDCVASSRCRTTRHADRCAEDGGAVNLSPTCCSNCTTTP